MDTYRMPVAKTVRNRGRIILWLLLAVGSLVTISGVLVEASNLAPDESGRVVSELLVTLGAGLVGAVLGIQIAEYLDVSTMEEVRTLLNATLDSRFISVDTELAQLRRPIHRYYATVVDGQYMWRAWVYHFEHSSGVGVLTTRVEELDEFGVMRQYKVEAGIRGNRLVIFGTRLSGQEAVSVSIYPGILGAFRQYHCGISFIQNFDTKEVVTRSIVSLEPLVDGVIGALPAEAGAKLDELWAKDFPRLFGSLLEGSAPS